MEYTHEDIKRGELTGFFGFAAAILFALLVTWVAGCGGGGCGGGLGSCIELEPEAPACYVEDACIPEVVEEFCETCITPERFTEQLDMAYNRGYRSGYATAEARCNLEAGARCDLVAWTCADFDDGRPNGHKPKECRN
jgi:hypothetical protein